MLSYQHIFHAGNLADVHKHATLAACLSYLTQKDKPISYIETHSGRALYHLDDDAALKTGEAEQGIRVAQERDWFSPQHPYAKVLDTCRADHGATAYPGSPMIAEQILRDTDTLHLAELHPQEADALRYVMPAANVYQQDGFEMALSITPPTPRRGLMLIDPSYEIKTDYGLIPDFIGKVNKKWNVGVILLWYPLLTSNAHKPMITALQHQFDDAITHEVTFPPARDGHRMIGSGLFMINAPFGIDAELNTLSRHFAKLGS